MSQGTGLGEAGERRLNAAQKAVRTNPHLSSLCLSFPVCEMET